MVFGATHGSMADQPFVFGVQKLVWTEAAKVKGGGRYRGTRGVL